MNAQLLQEGFDVPLADDPALPLTRAKISHGLEQNGCSLCCLGVSALWAHVAPRGEEVAPREPGAPGVVPCATLGSYLPGTSMPECRRLRPLPQ